MKATAIERKETDNYAQVLKDTLKQHNYIQNNPPIDEDWYRVSVNNIDFDLAIRYDHFAETVYNYVGVFYGLTLGKDITGETCHTTNFSDSMTFIFSSLDFSEVIDVPE